MNIRLTPLSLALAGCLVMVSMPGQAGWLDIFKRINSQNTPAAPPAQSNPSLPAANYPNGLGWRAVENDFIDVKAKIDVVEGKVDAVKADTVQILTELDDVDADHVIIKNELADIKTDLAMVKSDVSDIKADIADIETGLVDISDDLAAVADDVAMLKNTLQLQVSVDLAGANDVNDLPVTLYVQVTQNGMGVNGLLPDAFMFTNSFPFGIASYCGTPACFTEGVDGLYAVQLDGSWDAKAYAGTLIAKQTVSTPDGDVTSTGTSLATFQIPSAPVVP